MQEIAALLQAAKDNNLGVIPLVQTFGHLEFVLKLEQFKNLREEPSYPQSLCPSKEEAVNMVRTMVNQIMEIHRDSTHIHIGCDEVSKVCVVPPEQFPNCCRFTSLGSARHV